MKVASFFKRYKVKQRDGRVYDPIREKYVHATPEEYVRQKTIQFLIDYMEIPSDRIIVERSLSKLGVEGDRRRIDIGFFDPEGGFMAVVECKESLVGFNENAFVQAQDYLFDLHARFFFVTDGMTFMGYQYKSMNFIQMEEIPKYSALIKEDF